MLGVFAKVRHGGQNCIPRLQMILPGKKNKSLEKHINFFFFENSSVKFTEFVVESSCTVVKTAFYMYEGTIREKVGVGENRLLFLSLLKFNQNMFGYLAEEFRHGVQNCISRLQMILPRKKNKYLEYHINFSFENSSVKFTEFDGEASSMVVKTAFYMYEGTIREKIDVGEKSLLF